MMVLTIDQRGSRKGSDKVQALLEDLRSVRTVRPFQRTAGDEIQAVLDDPAIALGIALHLANSGSWSVGIGVGPVSTPLPAETRAGSGEAFILARTAVESAKKNSANICLKARPEHYIAAERIDASLQLVSLIERRRSAAAAEAGALLASGLTQREAGESLGISQQAVSLRLSNGLWHEAERMKAWIVTDLGELSS
ncbi:hypothetical protein HD598_000606 [Neomicrococcus aestuarii]|uniref:DNA-binding protein n=1 Tax=Neomicrococcus aestuarii TaxID=556325 RepID=A0A7W8TSC9_9MICC|nr:hypothetical protein [Neomicrococcus aestuarii]MBB5511919.1 hypothetical protein [Neomicrococcus aestuarii]